ncbi:MAG: hypothetical protein PHP52_07335 [Bacteroidales bacterium]|nr:hypothetical protein [Bacteroidales bacterium]MDD4216864.1 hypothetical protein [Bacteroidales bacterium]MDY0141922.1 hypothetical protein [Bacteroidales bacterium]
MKKIFLLSLVLFVSISSYAQVNKKLVMKHLAEVCDTSNIYRDVIITNADAHSWPALSNYQIEKSFYYSYSYYHGETLRMISEDAFMSAIKFTKYYIYDDFQNLLFFVYECHDCGELILKFDGDNVETIKSSNQALLNENYFLDSKSFNADSIKYNAKSMLRYCKLLWELPDYNSETEYIREKFKEINSMHNLLERKSGGVIGYYADNKLVKIVVKATSYREYYIDKGKLIFAYYPKTEQKEDIRVYFSGKPYKVIYGKENLSKTANGFHDIANKVQEDFNEVILKL